MTTERLENGTQIQITPYAILAAILFNIDSTETVKVMPDDGTEPIECEVSPVGLAVENDTCVAILPMSKVLHFAKNTYDYKVRTQGELIIVSFDKSEKVSALYDSSGLPVKVESPVVSRLITKMLGGSINE